MNEWTNQQIGQSSQQEVEFISSSLESGLGHVTGFDRWGKSHANRGLKTTFALRLALLLQGIFLLSHETTWTSPLEDESPWNRDSLSQLRPCKPTSLQMICWMTAATWVIPIETSIRTIQLNFNYWLPQITGTQNCEQIKRCLFYTIKFWGDLLHCNR